jgi:peptidoglycan/LPS O-acetylase OafA/YrhL
MEGRVGSVYAQVRQYPILQWFAVTRPRNSENLSTFRYRPEIDGIRAVAVLSVLIYHAQIRLAGFRLLPGGFLGVDVFFVLSGYLITGLIISELEANTFTFARFYERRARRILPALLLVIVACIPFAWRHMLPAPLEDFSNSAFAAIFSFSNIYFWLTGGYQAEPNAVKPLLHTWSLGIEEQFYILFPAVLTTAYFVSRQKTMAAILVCIATSLLFAEWMSRSHPTASFFLLPTRSWELLAGAVAAMKIWPKVTAPAWMLPAIGTLIVLIPMVTFKDETNHPGLLTAFPVAGTLILVQYGGTKEFVTRVFSSKPFVAMGLISYSLYLWHQPVFAFARIATAGLISTKLKLALIGVSFVLACFSYFAVERPFRNPMKVSVRALLLSLSACGVAIFCVAGGAIETRGFPSRLPIVVAELINLPIEYIRLQKDGSQCSNREPDRACSFGQGNWVLVGDSHAGTLAPTLERRLANSGQGIVDMTYQQCPFLPGFYFNREVQECPRINSERLAIISKLPSDTTIVIAAAPWLVLRATTEAGKLASLSEIAQVMRVQIGRLVAEGKRVILVYPVPQMPFDVPQWLVRIALAAGDLSSIQRALIVPVGRTIPEAETEIQQVYDSIPDQSGLLRVFPVEMFCRPPTNCTISNGQGAYFLDTNHLSEAGAEVVVGNMISVGATPKQ